MVHFTKNQLVMKIPKWLQKIRAKKAWKEHKKKLLKRLKKNPI